MDSSNEVIPTIGDLPDNTVDLLPSASSLGHKERSSEPEIILLKECPIAFKTNAKKSKSFKKTKNRSTKLKFSRKSHSMNHKAERQTSTSSLEKLLLDEYQRYMKQESSMALSKRKKKVKKKKKNKHSKKDTSTSKSDLDRKSLSKHRTKSTVKSLKQKNTSSLPKTDSVKQICAFCYKKLCKEINENEVKQPLDPSAVKNVRKVKRSKSIKAKSKTRKLPKETETKQTKKTQKKLKSSNKK